MIRLLLRYCFSLWIFFCLHGEEKTPNSQKTDSFTRNNDISGQNRHSDSDDDVVRMGVKIVTGYKKERTRSYF